MQKIHRYHYLISLAGVLFAVIFLYTLYQQRVQILQEEYLKLETTLVQKYIDAKKASISSQIDSLKQTLFLENKDLEEKATYELKHKLDLVYENIHALYGKYKDKKRTKELQETLFDLLRYGIDCNSEEKIFISDFNAELLYTADKTKEHKNYTLYTDADGRTIALELIQKVRKYSQTYIYTNTHEGSKKLIYAKDLGLYDWFIAASVDLTQRYRKLQETFVQRSKEIGLGEGEFIALYNKKTGEFIYKKSGKNFHAHHVDDVTQNLLEKASWYISTRDSNYYYSDFIESLDLYIIYGFAVKELM